MGTFFCSIKQPELSQGQLIPETLPSGLKRPCRKVAHSSLCAEVVYLHLHSPVCVEGVGGGVNVDMRTEWYDVKYVQCLGVHAILLKETISFVIRQTVRMEETRFLLDGI